MRLVAGIALALVAGVAAAHPLGNFTTNRQARITVAPDRIVVRYVVDAAELPAYRMLAEIDANGDGTPNPAERSAWAAALAGTLARDLHVTVDEQAVRLRPVAQEAAPQDGTGGLPPLRADVTLDAPLPTSRGTLVVRDHGFAGLPGWQEILVDAAAGTRIVQSTAGAVDRTNGLRAYPG